MHKQGDPLPSGDEGPIKIGHGLCFRNKFPSQPSNFFLFLQLHKPQKVRIRIPYKNIAENNLKFAPFQVIYLLLPLSFHLVLLNQAYLLCYLSSHRNTDNQLPSQYLFVHPHIQKIYGTRDLCQISFLAQEHIPFPWNQLINLSGFDNYPNQPPQELAI